MKDDAMRERSPIPPARLSAGVKLLLFFAAAAVVGLIVPWCATGVRAALGNGWLQGTCILLTVIVLLSALLVWMARTHAPIHAFSLVFGVLASLCLVVNGAFALAVFDYSVSRDPVVALRVTGLFPMLTAVVAVLGCTLSFVGGVVLSFFRSRAEKAAQTCAENGGSLSRRRWRWLPRVAIGALAVALIVALYSPVSYELSRRRAVLAIRAAGGQVLFDETGRMRIADFAGPISPFVSLIESPDEIPASEGWLYSLATVDGIRLAPGAGDEQLAYVFNLPEVTTLGLNDAQVTAEGFKRVGAELALRELYLQRTPVSAEGLRHVATGLRFSTGIPSLAVLDLSHAPLTDDSLTHLAGATALCHLNLSQTPITDEGLAHLAGMASLTQLDLCGTRITDDGLQHLSNMTGLQQLLLKETGITGPGLKHLKRVPLAWLDLSKTRLTNGGLSQLAGVPLSYLTLEGAHLDEPAVQELGTLRQLKQVNLQRTNVTGQWLRHLAAMKATTIVATLDELDEMDTEAIEALQKSLPNVMIPHLMIPRQLRPGRLGKAQ